MVVGEDQDVQQQECSVLRDMYYPVSPENILSASGSMSTLMVEECCSACHDEPHCTAWQWCGDRDGCQLPANSTMDNLEAYTCQLLNVPGFPRDGQPWPRRSERIAPGVILGTPLEISVPVVEGYAVKIGYDLGAQYDFACPGSILGTMCALEGTALNLTTACTQDVRCTAMVYYPLGVDFEGGPIGVLKNVSVTENGLDPESLRLKPSAALYYISEDGGRNDFKLTPDDELSKGLIIGLSVGLPLLIILASLALYAVLHLRPRRRLRHEAVESAGLEAKSLDGKGLDPSLTDGSHGGVGGVGELPLPASAQLPHGSAPHSSSPQRRGTALSSRASSVHTPQELRGLAVGRLAQEQGPAASDPVLAAALAAAPTTRDLLAHLSRAAQVVEPVDYSAVLEGARLVGYREHAGEVEDEVSAVEIAPRSGGARSGQPPDSFARAWQLAGTGWGQGGEHGDGREGHLNAYSRAPPSAGLEDLWARAQFPAPQLVEVPWSQGGLSTPAGASPANSSLGAAGGASAAPSPLGSLPASAWQLLPEEVEIQRRPDASLVQLGAGAYGVVYRGTLRGTSEVAVKILVNGGLDPERVAALCEREIALLTRLRDAHVVRFCGACVQGSATLLVTEFCELGDLWRALALRDQLGRVFAWQRRGRGVALDVARGLEYLHAQRVVHLDLKSANILLARDGSAKIADVGMARVLHGAYLSMLSAPGTLAWSAPEVLAGRRCNAQVDVYSLGVVLWEIVTGAAPVRGNMRPVRAPEECPLAVAELIARCTAENPADRPEARDVRRALERVAEAERREGGGGEARGGAP